MPKFKNSNETFWVIFKHCVIFYFKYVNQQKLFFCRFFPRSSIFQSCFLHSCSNWQFLPCFHTQWFILAFGWSACTFKNCLMVPTMHFCCTCSQRHYDQRMGCVSLLCFDYNSGLDWYFYCSCFYCSTDTFTKIKKINLKLHFITLFENYSKCRI